MIQRERSLKEQEAGQGDCGWCKQLRRVEPCPHRTKRVDDVFSMHVGEEYGGGVVIMVDRENSTVTLEPPEICYAPGRWR